MDMEPEVAYWMNSLSTKLRNRRIYEGLQNDLKPLAKVHSSARRRKMNHVWDLVFDIEDWVDQERPAMMHLSHQPEVKKKVDRFKAQIKQALELYERYSIVKEHPSPSIWIPVLPDERIPLLSHVERRDLIPLQELTSQLEERLLKSGEMMRKVVSIFGIEGSGKTSLAKEIYEKLHWQFECQAFVSVGRRASLRTTLLDILRQVKPGKIHPDRNTSQDLHTLRTEIWDYLRNKRYFIVLDGLWSRRAWEVINCALPNKNCGSRVLTTTCIINVAKYCSMHSIEDLYVMKPFSEYNTKVLLKQSMLQVDNDRALDNIQELSGKLLRFCDGMPLAIIVAAGLLSVIPEGQSDCKRVVKYIIGSLEQSSTSEVMTKILEISYDVLCMSLKCCFMYLSVFPEEYTITKDRLIWLWRAEGFITDMASGERYFRELCIRGLIQPVFNYDDDKAVGCTIHGVISEFIRSLSREENFVTVGADMHSGIFPCSSDTVRRLLLDCSSDRDEAHILASSTMHLLRMRSLTFFGDTEESGGRSAFSFCGDMEERDGRSALPVSDRKPVNILPCFKLIRVLDLEGADNLRSHQLEGVEGLVLLKYLVLRGTGIDKLPEDIGNLVHLEMLDVRQTKMTTLPASVGRLERLMRLLLDDLVEVPFDLSGMVALEEVSTIGPNNIISFFSLENLRRSRWRLRVLGVSLKGVNRASVMSVLSFITMHHASLQSISLYGLDHTFLRELTSSPTWCPKIELTIPGPILGYAVFKIPHSVTHLHMEVNQLTERQFSHLVGLRSLVLLKLVSARKGIGLFSIKRPIPSSRFIIRLDALHRLQVLCFTCKAGGMELKFERGAMPLLRRLGLCLSARETLSRYGDFEFGIQHLKGLTRVHATISCKNATVFEVEKAEGAIREQARQAGATTVELQRVLEDKMLDGGRE